MKITTLLLALIAVSSIAQGQRYDLTTTIDGRQRDFIVIVPPGPAPEGGYPLVMALHSSNHSGEDILSSSKWHEMGAEHGIVTVYPNSLRYCFDDGGQVEPYHPLKWNAGETRDLACDTNDLANDVSFLAKLIDTIKTTISINVDLLFLTGFSNGGDMTAKMGLERSNIFKAIAPVGSALHKNDSIFCANPPPAWNCVGTHDGYFIWDNRESIPFNDSCLTYLRSVLRRWLGAYRLEDIYEKDSTANTLTYTFTTPLPGAPPAFYRFSLIKDLGHQYANGSNSPVFYARGFWDFFLEIANTTSVVDNDPHPMDGGRGLATRVHPNPAFDNVTISPLQPEQEVCIYNMLGECVLNAVAEDRMMSVDVSTWPVGTYIVRAGSATTILICNRGR